MVETARLNAIKTVLENAPDSQFPDPDSWSMASSGKETVIIGYYVQSAAMSAIVAILQNMEIVWQKILTKVMSAD